MSDDAPTTDQALDRPLKAYLVKERHTTMIEHLVFATSQKAAVARVRSGANRDDDEWSLHATGSMPGGCEVARMPSEDRDPE